jgi:hypothetical protein
MYTKRANARNTKNDGIKSGIAAFISVPVANSAKVQMSMRFGFLKIYAHIDLLQPKKSWPRIGREM